ncbi:CPBP family intramembrane glutamic endopeptidase [Stackebrandtia nassauensis]|uniref:Abortive infection protein n=1 Tax=Stackebrandtia nassauensis (strain DSM 44728 / CIP 108903 / NRRL B-16338 / NBRC 102104 / LLR-40K-21) TaxID=446470 RepID=D3Q317_STANL|nr:type II CAAX endopeptidase family protein [Stackebrandtia nassauensis]ADD39987.1 Abortive infection protein [Stackebrandtia nassauensis DSM 44728]
MHHPRNPTVPPGVEYHRVLAGDKRRVGRGILAILLLVVGGAVFAFAASQAAGYLDARLGRTNPARGGSDYTPIFHAATMFSLALLIPWSMLIQRWLYGVRGASLHSVLSRFRLDVFGRALLIIGPIWLIPTVVLNVAMPAERTHWSNADLVAVFATTLLLTPLQTAGEEYGVRGLVFRVAGSWSRGPRLGLVLGVLVSSLAFTAVHGSSDPWIILWYFTLAVSLAVITWRTGGIETAIVIHALLNTLTFLLAIVVHADLTNTDRSAGAGSVALLVPSVVVAGIAAVVWLWTRRTGPVLTPSRASTLTNK